MEKRFSARICSTCTSARRKLGDCVSVRLGPFADLQLRADHEPAQPVVHELEELELLVPRERHGLRRLGRLAGRPSLIFTIESNTTRSSPFSSKWKAARRDSSGGEDFHRIRSKGALIRTGDGRDDARSTPNVPTRRPRTGRTIHHRPYFPTRIGAADGVKRS